MANGIRFKQVDGEVYMHAGDLCDSFDVMANVAGLVGHSGVATTLVSIVNRLRKLTVEALTETR